MSFIRRKWTPLDADEWTKEDWIAIILSPLAYILLTLGITGAFLLLTWGYVTLAIGIVLTIVMHWVIDPKLKTISGEYEKRQKDYLIELERNARWEDHDG